MSLLATVEFHLIGVISAISVKPDPNAVPGTPSLEKLVNGLAALALLACGAWVIIGAGQIGAGQRGNNFTQTSDGQTKVRNGLIGAFVVGAAAGIINFFYSAGSAVH